ncbi:MAG TPA: hypothetical protein VGH93_03205 [Solirubrobacteraceae bacterium]
MPNVIRVQQGVPQVPGDPALGRWWGRHPQEQGEPIAPRPVPEIGDIVPNRHSASAEAALLRWREAHDEL